MHYLVLLLISIGGVLCAACGNTGPATSQSGAGARFVNSVDDAAEVENCSLRFLRDESLTPLEGIEVSVSATCGKRWNDWWGKTTTIALGSTRKDGCIQLNATDIEGDLPSRGCGYRLHYKARPEHRLAQPSWDTFYGNTDDISWQSLVGAFKTLDNQRVFAKSQSNIVSYVELQNGRRKACQIPEDCRGDCQFRELPTCASLEHERVQLDNCHLKLSRQETQTPLADVPVLVKSAGGANCMRFEKEFRSDAQGCVALNVDASVARSCEVKIVSRPAAVLALAEDEFTLSLNNQTTWPLSQVLDSTTTQPWALPTRENLLGEVTLNGEKCILGTPPASCSSTPCPGADIKHCRKTQGELVASKCQLRVGRHETSGTPLRGMRAVLEHKDSGLTSAFYSDERGCFNFDGHQLPAQGDVGLSIYGTTVHMLNEYYFSVGNSWQVLQPSYKSTDITLATRWFDNFQTRESFLAHIDSNNIVAEAAPTLLFKTNLQPGDKVQLSQIDVVKSNGEPAALFCWIELSEVQCNDDACRTHASTELPDCSVYNALEGNTAAMTQRADEEGCPRSPEVRQFVPAGGSPFKLQHHAFTHDAAGACAFSATIDVNGVSGLAVNTPPVFFKNLVEAAEQQPYVTPHKGAFVNQRIEVQHTFQFGRVELPTLVVQYTLNGQEYHHHFRFDDAEGICTPDASLTLITLPDEVLDL